MKLTVFKDSKEFITKWVKEIDRIPTRDEIDKNPKLKNGRAIHREFQTNLGVTMREYFNSLGYFHKSGAFDRAEDFQKLCDKVIDTCIQLKRIPTRNELKAHGLPSYSTLNTAFTKHLKMGYTEFLQQKGFRTGNSLIYLTEDFDKIESYLHDWCRTLGRAPTFAEVDEDDYLPSAHSVNSVFKKVKNTTFTVYFKSLGFDQYTATLETMHDFEEIQDEIVRMCENEGVIPLEQAINENERIPDAPAIRELFARNGYENGYQQFCVSKGYSHSIYRDSYFTSWSKEKIEDLWENWKETHGQYPSSEDCSVSNRLPAWSRVKAVFGDSFDDFYKKYGRTVSPQVEDYEEYCALFKCICEQEGRVLTNNDLVNNLWGLPSSRWFVKYCPDKSVVNYNHFISYLGLKPKYEVTKDYATKQILRKYRELNRPLLMRDFASPEKNEIGIGIITSRWGSFNKMLEDLGLPVTNTNTTDTERSIEDITQDVIRLCEQVFEETGRKNISYQDFEEYDWCLDTQVYNRWLKRELDMTLSEYIESIGFIPNKAGMGMVHTFDDGEVTLSKYEYDVSVYLRDQNISYTRDVKYNTFIQDYAGNKNCDYVIVYNNQTYYVEVAGMLSSDKVSTDNLSPIHQRYFDNLSEKISMFEGSNLNYHIIYPHDIATKTMDELFAFLQ